MKEEKYKNGRWEMGVGWEDETDGIQDHVVFTWRILILLHRERTSIFHIFI